MESNEVSLSEFTASLVKYRVINLGDGNRIGTIVYRAESFRIYGTLSGERVGYFVELDYPTDSNIKDDPALTNQYMISIGLPSFI